VKKRLNDEVMKRPHTLNSFIHLIVAMDIPGPVTGGKDGTEKAE